MENQNNKFLKGIFFILLFFLTILCGMLFKVMADVFKPVVLAVLLSLVFYPLIRRLCLFIKLPWWLSTVIVYLAFFVAFFLVANILTASFKAVILAIPRYQERFNAIQDSIRLAIEAHPNSKFFALLNFDEEASLFANLNNQFNILEYLKSLAIDFTGSVVVFMKTLFLVVLLSIFLLAEFKKTKHKVRLAFTDEHNLRVIKIVHNIIKDTTHYISIKFVISLFTGIFIFIACALTRMGFPLVWAFLAFCFNFIPTFGSIASCAITILFSIIQFYPSPVAPIIIGIWVITVNMILGNVIEPKIEGDNLGISPFVILVSLSLAGWLWGILGMILAVPLMVIIKIVCENISYLKPIAVFLGNKSN